MAKLPPMSRHADIVRSALREGRRRDAVEYAVEKLRSGESHQLFLNAVADLLVEPERRPGGQKKQEPRQWYEIGRDFEGLTAQGLAVGQAYTKLAAMYSVGGERTVSETVKFYLEAADEARAAESEAYESDSQRVKEIKP